MGCWHGLPLLFGDELQVSVQATLTFGTTTEFSFILLVFDCFLSQVSCVVQHRSFQLSLGCGLPHHEGRGS